MSTVDLPSGTVHYRTAGPENSQRPVVVFAHAFLMNGAVFSPVADLLAEQGIRSYAPDLPLGAHQTPMRADADQSPRGIARLLLAFLDALDLDDVTLVGSDTGGAIAQFALDTDASRIGRVVLTNCDAFETFPPFPFSAIFRLLGGTTRMRLNLLPMRSRVFRHSPLGFGLLANKLDAGLTRSWIEPALADARVRRDAVRTLRAVDPAELFDVSNRLNAYRGPVRIVWGMSDRAFRPALGKRLGAAFHDAEFVAAPGARTLVQLDAPDLLAKQISQLAPSP